MLAQFLKLKYRTFRPQGGVQVRGVDIANCSLERSTSFVCKDRELNFSVLDCRSMPRVKATETTAAIDLFLRCVGEKLKPPITDSNLWLFIVEDDEVCGNERGMNAFQRLTSGCACKSLSFEQVTPICYFCV